MASAVGCDNVRDDLAAFVLLAEIKNISAVKEKKSDCRLSARGVRSQQELGKTGCIRVELVLESPEDFPLVLERQEKGVLSDAADACVQQEEALIFNRKETLKHTYSRLFWCRAK